MSNGKCLCINYHGSLYTQGRVYGYTYEPGGQIRIMANNGSSYGYDLQEFYDSFKFLSAAQSVKAEGDTVTKKSTESYTFNVQSQDQIDLFEIMECLTREAPVGIVHTSNQKIAVVLHSCIYSKAELMPKRFIKELDAAISDLEGEVRFGLEDTFQVNLAPLDSKKINRVTAAIKAIRSGQIKKKYRQALTVRVDLLEL